MRKVQELNGVDCVDNSDLHNAAEQIFNAAHALIGFQNPCIDANLVTHELQLQTMQNNPQLVGYIATLATFEKFRLDYADQQNTTHSLLEGLNSSITDLIESIDCAGAKPIEHWRQSDKAAIDKANELGINILPEYSMADLRYKIDCAIHGVI
jgi:hypothetical protein